MKRILLLLLFSAPLTFPISTGLSCLYNPVSGKKISIIYDKHLAQFAKLINLPADTLKEVNNLIDQQTNDLKNLAASLEKEAQESLFLHESPSFGLKYTDPDAKSILHVIPQIFAQNESNKRGNLTFTHADPREDTYFRALEFRLRIPEFKKDIEEGELNEDFKKITIDFYLNYLKTVIHNVLEKLEALSLEPTIADKLRTRLNRLNSNLDSYIKFALKEYDLKKDSHLAYLYEKEIDLNRAHLINMAEQIGILQFDIEFLNLIKNNPVKNIVVQAGGLHAKFITHQLQKMGYSLIDEYGDTEDIRIDEEQRAHLKKEPQLNLETVQELQVKALNNIDNLVINCLHTTITSSVED